MDILRITRDGQSLARTTLWLVDAVRGHTVVAIPRLHLSQEAALSFNAGQNYSEVFKEAKISVLGNPERNFVVVHASLDLYKVGSSTISSFAVFIPSADAPLPPWVEVIRKTADMLRSSSNGCNPVQDKVDGRGRQASRVG